MKYLLAFVSGFLLTLVIFVSGAAVTVVYLTAEPVPVHRPNAGGGTSTAWTAEPVRMARAGQHASDDRNVTGPEEALQTQTSSRHTDSGAALDLTATTSIAPTQSVQQDSELRAAHIAWCSEQYRSYNIRENRYISYSGERRKCVSPFSEGSPDLKAGDEAGNVISVSSDETSALSDARYTRDDPVTQLSPEHIRSCFARYRSYRPDDNSYQPYGGGPRRQCQ